MTGISLWLSALAGMLALDTVLCALYLKKVSESLLELTVTILVGVIAKLLHDNPISYLNSNVYQYIAAGAVLITICVMFYHLYKVIITRPDKRKNRHHRNTNPAEKKRDH